MVAKLGLSTNNRLTPSARVIRRTSGVYPQNRELERRNVGIRLGTCCTPPCRPRGFSQEIVAYLEGEMKPS
jgi:hypothetical protein